MELEYNYKHMPNYEMKEEKLWSSFKNIKIKKNLIKPKQEANS